MSVNEIKYYTGTFLFFFSENGECLWENIFDMVGIY